MCFLCIPRAFFYHRWSCSQLFCAWVPLFSKTDHGKLFFICFYRAEFWSCFHPQHVASSVVAVIPRASYQRFRTFFDEIDLVKSALSCHFAPDLLCYKEGAYDSVDGMYFLIGPGACSFSTTPVNTHTHIACSVCRGRDCHLYGQVFVPPGSTPASFTATFCRTTVHQRTERRNSRNHLWIQNFSIETLSGDAYWWYVFSHPCRFSWLSSSTWEYVCTIVWTDVHQWWNHGLFLASLSVFFSLGLNVNHHQYRCIFPHTLCVKCRWLESTIRALLLSKMHFPNLGFKSVGVGPLPLRSRELLDETVKTFAVFPSW